MSLLVRSRKPVATWTWVVEREEGSDAFESGAAVAVRLARALEGSDVFTPEGIDVQWNQDNIGYLGIRSRLSGVSGLTARSLVERVRNSRPDGYELAQPTVLKLLGTGRWVAADDSVIEEPDLIDISLDVVTDTMVELAVHHDIWAENSFSGIPHPEVHVRNAPRLRETLITIEEELGVETEPDGSTPLGRSFNYGVESHKGVDGGPFDVTPWL